MDNKKKVGLIITIVTILLCACPGIIMLVVGGSTSYFAGTADGGVEAQLFPISLICIGVIGILISLAAGINTLVQHRKDSQIEEIKDIPDPLSGE